MLSALALMFSAFSLVIAVAAAVECRRGHRHPTIRKHLNELRTEVLNCLDQQEKLYNLANRKYQRDMQRRRRAEDDDDELSDDEWIRQTNLQLLNGGKPDAK